MKVRNVLPLILGLVYASLSYPVDAQTAVPTQPSSSTATGEITGVIINQSPKGIVPENATVMLHVLDQNYEQLGMLHTEAKTDGSFSFVDVPLSPGLSYVGFVTYKGASYTSPPMPFDGESTPNIELYIYETTSDLSSAQIEKIHVLFNFEEDGLEVDEIYLLSNLGEYTITGTLTLADGQPATIKLPLPPGADYVFFKPDSDPDRFVILPDGFADKAALVPGESSSQFMVSYLATYTDEMSYSYTAPISIRNIDFLLPADEGVIIDGQNIQGPELTTLKDNAVYQVYSYKEISAGQTVRFDFLGKPNFETTNGPDDSQVKSKIPTSKLAIELGSGLVGLVMIGVGVWQWRKSRDDDSEVEAGNSGNKSRLDKIIAEIAQLDESRDRGEIDAAEHQQRRAILHMQAKALLDARDNGL